MDITEDGDSTAHGFHYGCRPEASTCLPDVSNIEQLVESHLVRARVIASEYANIPGATWKEILAEAEMALAAAARKFDETKGRFEPYAGTAIRNALNSFFDKQVRYVRFNDVGLPHEKYHDTGSQIGEAPVDSREDVVLEVRRTESRKVLDEVIANLPPRYRMVIAAIRAGQSYSEIGITQGVSKQAIHKVANAAFAKLREDLLVKGFRGVDSTGGLNSQSRSS